MNKTSLDTLKKNKAIQVLSAKSSRYILGGGAVSKLKNEQESEDDVE